MVSGSADTDLTCPVWVQFYDPVTQLPYFYNVQTHERAEVDADPSGDLRCSLCDVADGKSASDAENIDPNIGSEGCAAEQLSGNAADHLTSDDSLATDKATRWRQYPACVQVEYDPDKAAKIAYIEGNEEYNIWFGKFQTSRFDRNSRADPASYRLNPATDCGWTQADIKGAEKGYFCFFFAKGCCSMGHKCKYHHHIPAFPDGERDIANDIFGRARFRCHNDKMSGVGSFNSECRTIFVSDLRFDRSQGKNAVQHVERQIWEDFGQLGDIEEVRVLPVKAIAFVRYSLRASAEFAKVVMGDQRLGLAPLIGVKWAHDDPDPKAIKRRKLELQEKVDEFLDQTIESMGLSQVEVAGMQLQANLTKSCTAPYPDTSLQYPSKSPMPPTQAQHNAASESNAADTKAMAEQAIAASNVDRLSLALTKIDAMKDAEDLETLPV